MITILNFHNAQGNMQIVSIALNDANKKWMYASTEGLRRYGLCMNKPNLGTRLASLITADPSW